MDLYRDDEPPIRQATVRRRPPISDASALLVVIAAIAVMGVGAAWIGFHLGESSALVEPLETAASPVPKLRDEPAPTPATRSAASVPLPPPAAPVVHSDEGLLPRIKPSRLAVAAAEDPALPAGGRTALVLGQPWLATDDDRPPSALFLDDAIADRTPPPSIAVAYAKDLAAAPRTIDIALARGETFVDALRRAGVRAEDRNAATAAFAQHQNLRQLRPGQNLRVTVAPPNETVFQSDLATDVQREHLLALDFRSAPGERLLLKRDAAGTLRVEKKATPLTQRTVSVAGVINGSLFVSAKRVGAPDEVIAQLATVFAYDVDFQREIFGGDEFEALFEVRYDDLGALVSASDVLYARLKFKGRTKEKAYYRFVADGVAEYFDRNGESAKRLLMKTPIDGARLSSAFGSRRHPILGYMKQHKGVDFAAPTGTPIKAAGDGVVERSGPFSSFGNYVKIRHNSGYQTAYAHLSRIARGAKKGARVRQGEVIGFVGTTGRSTGPHLHYEVHFKNQPVNPQTLKVATGVELYGPDLKRFKAARDAIDAMRAGTTRGRAPRDAKAASL